MNLVANECSRCGAKIQVDAATPVVTCKFCGTQLAAEHDDPEVRCGLTKATRSEDTGVPVSVTFVNKVGRALDLVWLDFKGQVVDYGRVEPGQWQNFSTYIGHVWSIREAGSSDEVLRWAAPDQVTRHVLIR